MRIAKNSLDTFIENNYRLNPNKKSLTSFDNFDSLEYSFDILELNEDFEKLALITFAFYVSTQKYLSGVFDFMVYSKLKRLESGLKTSSNIRSFHLGLIQQNSYTAPTVAKVHNVKNFITFLEDENIEIYWIKDVEEYLITQ